MRLRERLRNLSGLVLYGRWGTRDDAMRVMADWYLGNLFFQNLYSSTIKAEFIRSLLKQFKAEFVHLHYDRHCEAGPLNEPRVKLELQKYGIPVLSYEGNIAEKGDFDIPGTLKRVDNFMQFRGIERLVD